MIIQESRGEDGPQNAGQAAGALSNSDGGALFVGRRCRTATIQAVARELHLDWKTVKELDKQYMREQLRRVGTPAPRVLRRT